MSDNTLAVALCPHCGNKSSQRLIHKEVAGGTGWDIADGQEFDLIVVYFVASCQTCHHILVYRAVDDIPEDVFFYHVELVYPGLGEMPKSVPEKVATIYKEASRIRALAPNAFAGQIRRALEALCDDKRAKKDTLQKMLAALVATGDIPPALAEASDILRLLGNIGAHASDETVKPWQVYAIDEFFRAVIEYVYIAPAKVREFKDTLARQTQANEK